MVPGSILGDQIHLRFHSKPTDLVIKLNYTLTVKLLPIAVVKELYLPRFSKAPLDNTCKDRIIPPGPFTLIVP